MIGCRISGATPNVDDVRAAVWWHETNVEQEADPAVGPATFDVRLCSRLGKTVNCQGSVGNTNTRVFESDVAPGGREWFVRITPGTVPPSIDPWLLGLQARSFYIGAFFEDTARDDADGPTVDIQ